jgi:lipopolysaccharide/colanic/teichoic acid biosynthesis glycosyltransferase
VTVFAGLLDTRPGYLRGGRGPASLLLVPLGTATVLRFLGERLVAMGHRKVTIVTDFDPEPGYERRVRGGGIEIDAVLPAREFAGWLDDCEPSDWLALLDPRCVPPVGPARGSFALESDGPRRVQHLVVLESHPGGTTERVQLAANGAVGRIQRYYDSATWPFTSGVAASVLPVSCMVGAREQPFSSLRELRRGLAQRGVPSSDTFLRGGAYDLSRERDVLGLSERVMLEHFSRRRADGWSEVGRGCEVDASARLVGPVIVQEGASIGPRATVIGPAVIGPRARVERDAMVAQCVTGPDAVVAAGDTVRHRVVFGAAGEEGTAAPAWERAAVAAVESGDGQERRGRGAGAHPAVKVAFDVTASGLGLLFLSPLLLVIAALVKLGSKGPVLYRDLREGKGGRAFACLKFRTMRAGADALQRELSAANQLDGPQFKIAGDPRVTGLGAVLRRLNFDELPQLVNVVRREMSLVGPRPSPFRENQMCIPWRDGRLSVRPGITGLWQVCRNRRADGDFHQWIHYDLLYVRHMSLAVDLKIIAATVLTLGGRWPVPLRWIIPSASTEAEVRPRAEGSLPSPAGPQPARTTGLAVQ